jgi:histidinol phosphatase-like PHP family hydrolase
MHSSEVSGCAAKSAAEQVHTYKDRGYAGIILTDHFVNGFTICPHHLPWREKMIFTISGYEQAKREGEKCGLDVFLGWEYTIRGSDFLTYGLDIDFLLAHPDLDKLSIEKYSALVRSNGGFLAQAHPYKDEPYVEYKYPADPRFLDAVEVYNSSIHSRANKKALAFAQKHNLPMQAGTDSHGRFDRFFSGVELDKKAGSIFDIISAISNRTARPVVPK